MDYQAIIDQLTEDRVKAILTKLEIPFEDCGSYLKMPTYCHNHMSEEASKKLYYYKNNKIFMCYTEDGVMSIFKFLRNFYEAQGKEYDWYRDIYRVIIGESAPDGFVKPKYKSLKEIYQPAPKAVELPEYDKKVLDCFVKRYPPEWLTDGISKEAMDKYNILFSLSQNKIIIPHYDVNNRLIGIRGRALNADEIQHMGKYMPVQIEGKFYSHPLSMNLYGLNFNRDIIKQSGLCFIFEAEKSVLQLESFRIPHCGVAVCGSQLNKFALSILRQSCQPREVIICFDNEELPGEDKYFNKLYKLCSKYINYFNISFIYDRKHLTQLKDSPTDRGEKIFKELIAGRVVVR